MTRVILVRHGQTEWNRVERFRGRIDLPLNQTGVQQAILTAKRIAVRWKPMAIYSSPLQRALQTASHIAQPLHLEVKPVDGFIDIDYGKWQGLTPQEAEMQWRQEVVNWYEHPNRVKIPEGEPLQQVRERAMAALSELCKRHGEEEIVVVSHTVVNRLILLGVLGIGNEYFWGFHQDPCAINLIDKSEKSFEVVLLNDICHLEQPLD